MLPIRRALKPAVEWAPPCRFAAVVSGAGTKTSLLMRTGGLEMLRCTKQSEAAYGPALGTQPSPILGSRHAKLHKYLNCDPIPVASSREPGKSRPGGRPAAIWPSDRIMALGRAAAADSHASV